MQSKVLVDQSDGVSLAYCREKQPFADLLGVDGDPYRGVTVLQGEGRHLAAIMLNGRFVKDAL